MKKTLKAILFLMVPVFTLSLFACKAETDTEYVEVEKIVEVEKEPDSTPPQKIIAGENAAKAGKIPPMKIFTERKLHSFRL